MSDHLANMVFIILDAIQLLAIFEGKWKALIAPKERARLLRALSKYLVDTAAYAPSIRSEIVLAFTQRDLWSPVKPCAHMRTQVSWYFFGSIHFQKCFQYTIMLAFG